MRLQKLMLDYFTSPERSKTFKITLKIKILFVTFVVLEMNVSWQIPSLMILSWGHNSFFLTCVQILHVITRLQVITRLWVVTWLSIQFLLLLTSKLLWTFKINKPNLQNVTFFRPKFEPGPKLELPTGTLAHPVPIWIRLH